MSNSVQAVLFAGLKNMVARLLSFPFIGRLLGLVYQDCIPSRGLRIDTSNVDLAVKATLFWGMYESAEIRFIHTYLRKDLNVIELGSSLGVVSCHIRRKLSKDCRLICVEANPKLASRIQQNIKINTLGEAEIYTAAVCYKAGKNGKTQFYIRDTNLISSLEDKEDFTATKICVPAFTLSGILEQATFSEFSLVCDIEGAESGILLYDAPALNACQQMVIELHKTREAGRIYSVDDLIDLAVDRHGFHLCARYGPVCVFDRAT